MWYKKLNLIRNVVVINKGQQNRYVKYFSCMLQKFVGIDKNLNNFDITKKYLLTNKNYSTMYAKSNVVKDDKYRIVDLRSDTVSIPTPEMRRAMAEADVGDDVYGEDPTINELEERSAKLFNKDAAVFVPSGTMANLLAIMVHCGRRGTEAICGTLSHTFLYEQGGAAHIAGVQLRTIENNPNGTFCLNDFKTKIRGDDQHEPVTALAIVENTHNMCGGKILPMEWIDELAKICKENDMALHMDGARVFNASAALHLPVSRIVRDFDSVCYCLSKGLSAPVGSVLIGSKSFIKEARRLRKALGGGMRQAGVLAAAGMVALDSVVPLLGTDHKRIKEIANAIYNLKSSNISVNIESVQTNILLINMLNPKKLPASAFQQRVSKVTDDELKANITDENGKGIVIKVSSRDWSFARIVIYHQISDSDVAATIKKFIYCINELDKNIIG